MKVKQVVGEHKKGVRAMKYNKKPVNPSAVHAKAKEKLQPVKPMEAIEVKPMPGASQVVGDGGKVIATTDAATANTIKTAAEKGQFTPTDGTEAPVPETQNDDIGGDPTDDFIDELNTLTPSNEYNSLNILLPISLLKYKRVPCIYGIDL